MFSRPYRHTRRHGRSAASRRITPDRWRAEAIDLLKRYLDQPIAKKGVSIDKAGTRSGPGSTEPTRLP
ncbi:hypothetical protein ACPEIC_10700 [Stenotrophomonas sp. NPDC087984]